MLGSWHFQTWTRLIPHMPNKKLGAQQCRPSPGTETGPGTPSLTALGLCRLLIRPTKPTHLPTLCDMEGFLACHWETEAPGGPPGGTLGSCAVSRCVILRRYNKVSGPGSGASAQCQGLNPGWDPCGLGMLPPHHHRGTHLPVLESTSYPPDAFPRPRRRQFVFSSHSHRRQCELCPAVADKDMSRGEVGWLMPGPRPVPSGRNGTGIKRLTDDLDSALTLRTAAAPRLQGPEAQIQVWAGPLPEGGSLPAPSGCGSSLAFPGL